MKNKQVLMKKKIMRAIYRIIYYVGCIILFVFKHIGKLMKYNDLALSVMLPFCEAAEVMSDCYVTCKFRPKSADMILEHPNQNETRLKQIAIVIQGPIIKKNDYTLETVKLYQKIYPGVLVVVSTWDDIESEYIVKFKKLNNCHVILNQKPKMSGNLNINYQIASTMAGLQYAQEVGKKYVFKIRSDMRLYKVGILDELYTLVQKYPCFEENSLGQKYRLVVFNAYVARPYNFSDFYMFGYVDDMLNYWNLPLQECSSDSGYVIANQMEIEKWTYRDVFESNLAPEIEITRNYIERVNGKSECKIDCYWEFVKSSFITLPHTYLDTLWYKYDYNREENYIQKTYVRSIYGANGESMLTFSFDMWLDLFEGKFSLDSQKFEGYIDELA